MIRTIIGGSLAPTRYKVRTPTGEYYVRCGADLLLNAMGTDLEAEAKCPVCEGIIRFRVRDREVRELDPSTSLLHIVEIRMANGRHAVKCEGSPIFDKDDCLQDWLNDYQRKRGLIFKPQEFLERMISLRGSEEAN
jgi:Alkylmercury lyase